MKHFSKSGVLGDERVNILPNVFINELYSAETFDSWLVDIDTTNGEIDFNSNDEAGHFAEIVNKLYFTTSTQTWTNYCKNKYRIINNRPKVATLYVYTTTAINNWYR